MRGNPQPAIRPDDLAHGFGGQVVLPDVYAVEPGSQTQIGAVIHDEADEMIGSGVPHFSPILGEVGILTLGREPSSQFARLLQRNPRIPGFIAILNQLAASCHDFSGCGNHRVDFPETVRIEDGVEPRKPHTHFPFFARKRSMKPVSILPARKSGSAKIFRCSGMVVYTPSTMNISSARAMRDIASFLSLARTISLAIRES